MKSVFVTQPGFTADCLETIDEIGNEGREDFEHAGGEHLVRAPCLNDDAEFIDALAGIVRRESTGMGVTPPKTKNTLLIDAIEGRPTPRTPVWAMRQAGRWDPEFLKLRGDRDFYSFSDDAHLAAAASLCPRRFGVDAIILFYDITTLAASMGQKFHLEPNHGPRPERPIRTLADVEATWRNPPTNRRFDRCSKRCVSFAGNSTTNFPSSSSPERHSLLARTRSASEKKSMKSAPLRLHNRRSGAH